jgi:hypothetical protein
MKSGRREKVIRDGGGVTLPLILLCLLLARDEAFGDKRGPDFKNQVYSRTKFCGGCETVTG